MSKRITVLAASLAFTCVLAAAAHAVTPEQARAFLQVQGARAVGGLQAADAPMRGLGRLLAESMHFEKIAKAALGVRGRRVRQAQLAELGRLMAALVVQRMAERLAEARPTGFTVGAARQMPNGDVIVEATLRLAGGAAVATGWRIADTDRGLRIVDIELEGYSMRIHYMNRFEPWLRRDGIDGLIERLHRMVGGTVVVIGGPAERRG